jgi:probable F420-dependent oxidoreductase
MKVRIAVSPGGTDGPAGLQASWIDGLEERGFDTVWLSDIPLGPNLDPGVGLAYAAGRTRRLKLGANVVAVGRNPVALAKRLAQLDQLSGGRLLLTIVPGLGDVAEREALGVLGVDRGAVLEEVVTLLRRFWSGEPVEHHSARFSFSGVMVPVPAQDPLVLWLAGHGPQALERAGRLGDGWLGAALSPAEAGVARRRIEQAAAAAGRVVDPEHFGLSIPYARREAPAGAIAQIARRRPDADPAGLLPVGATALRDLISSLVGEGLSKFVLRPVAPVGPADEELDWLAAAVLDLQS